ncbi:hypothetical protein L1D14_16190 [Vibrio tubiashii]|uniref:hypothetical protein n=1 Tax=Vibrio tubiashii TaxID=29498 RepID=UPI001EFD1E09|nr:hypothetical protein [Vibrio tubiashii]MCG9577767.1 hypothetical protein [Vibrio tubiashii]
MINRRFTVSQLLAVVGTLILVSQLWLIISSLQLAKKQAPNHDLAGALIVAWTKTDSFLDDVYTFNIPGIKSSLENFLTAYEKSNINAKMCIQVAVSSFSVDDRDVSEHCTKGTSIAELTSNASQITLHSGSVPITVASKQLAAVSYYLSQGEGLTYRGVGSSVITSIVFAEMLLIGSLVWVAKHLLSQGNNNRQTETAPPLDTPSEKQNLNNILKIVNSNKRAFAINEDITLVNYKHPYSEVIYKSGLSTKIKCSLTDLEQSFPIPLVRLNRSTLVKKELFESDENIDIKTNKDGHTVSIWIKGKEHELKVSSHYQDNLMHLISRGT